ncbi:protein S100-A4-like isoform X1 [Grus americana]|uniref:protein S100-A4-like isoform X1 n=2 Tax=Grus americana TaxID=9117 RepID=UPI002407CE4B|nr:protein S100-A4-like isoform X1 [Grus americana]
MVLSSCQISGRGKTHFFCNHLEMLEARRRLAMTCPLEQALAVMVTTFHKYSGKEGDKYKLSKQELKELLNKELPVFGSKQMDEAEFRRLMNDLDHDKDSEVDFKEYVCFLACITMGFNEFFKDGPTKQPRKK